MNTPRAIPWNILTTAIVVALVPLLILVVNLLIDPGALGLTVVGRWIITILLLIAMAAAIGRGLNGRWDGLLIDERNKISLSRFQMIAWTILILSALAALILGRAHALMDNPSDVSLPQELWLLMGISTTSLIGSPLVRSATQRSGRTPDLSAPTVQTTMQRMGGDVQVEGNVVGNVKPNEAAWADMFAGELVNNAAKVDLTKTQNFYFTAVTLLIYAGLIGQSFSAATLPDTMPALPDTMLVLLGISHAGYLIGKGTQSVKQEDEPTTVAVATPVVITPAAPAPAAPPPAPAPAEPAPPLGG